MPEYLGTKKISAVPHAGENGEPGYKVVYADGYTSWSPKEVFEEAYHEIIYDPQVDILKYFKYEHLPEHLQVISKPFCHMAMLMCSVTPHCPERTAGLRKLLEAKDCAVRAALSDSPVKVCTQ